MKFSLYLKIKIWLMRSIFKKYLWSVFSANYNNEFRIFAYIGNHSNFNKEDWRFSNVKKERENVTFHYYIFGGLHEKYHQYEYPLITLDILSKNPKILL